MPTFHSAKFSVLKLYEMRDAIVEIRGKVASAPSCKLVVGLAGEGREMTVRLEVLNVRASRQT